MALDFWYHNRWIPGGSQLWYLSDLLLSSSEPLNQKVLNCLSCCKTIAACIFRRVLSTESWNRKPFSDFRQVTISALTWDRIHRRTWTSRYVQCKPSISSHPNVDSWARQNSSKSLRNSVLNSWLKSVQSWQSWQSLTPSYKTPSRVISTPWNPKISSFWMVSPFPRVSFLVPAVSFQEYIWDQQIHRNSVLPKWQMCEESQSGRPILISKAKGERQNSWTVEIYQKKHVPMKSRGIRRISGGQIS